MNEQQTQAEMTAIIKDLATVMKQKGMTDKDIDQTLLKLTTQVEMAMVEEVLTQLPPQRRKVLEELSGQNKSPEEIAKVVKFNMKKVAAIEVQKFKEIFGEYLASLDAK